MDDAGTDAGRRGPARLADVAQVAGVSVATVSRALSHPQALSPETRAAVERAIAATGYRVNRTARNLRTGRTGAVVALVPNLGNPFFGKILAGMGATLNREGYDLLVGDTLEPGGRHRVLSRFLDPSRADGIILLDGQVTPDQLAAAPGGPPVVMACEWIEGSGLPRIVLDNAAGTAMAARHLTGLGHRRIGWIGGPPDNVLHGARRAGLARVLGAAGSGYPGDFSLGSGVRAATSWLATPPADRPTAVIGFSDEAAAGFMGELQRCGTLVPRDVSVIGFDGIDWIAHLPVPLSTVRQPKRDIGAAAARILIARIAGETVPQDTVLTPELVLRASCGPAPSGST